MAKKYDYIFAIDPGSEQSAFVRYCPRTKEFLETGIVANNSLLAKLENKGNRYADSELLAIEGIASMGMAVGKSTFDTCIWIGRFIQAWGGVDNRLIYRYEVKMFLCNSMRAKDKNIRQAIIDRYEPTGGGKVPQIGTKAQPGPLYGISSHLWSALAVAITASEAGLCPAVSGTKGN